jgi:thymidylate synthase (FAD)
MHIVKPGVEVVFHYPLLPENCGRTGAHGEIEDAWFPAHHVEQFLEKAGRTCYKSEDHITEDSSHKFIKMLNDRGHKAMLEHCFASCKFVCDRGVTHELVRHRIASYAQESTRYCNYSKDKFDNQISVIKPPGLDTEDKEQYWKSGCLAVEHMYMKLIEADVPPQIARSVLPTCLKTEIWCSTNLREWQHIFSLRCAPTAHPQIREVMLMALEKFKDEVPTMFDELWNKYENLV